MRKFSKIESELLLKEELTVGIDEVGRGSLIGPVVACAFQLDSIIKNIELNDSKMLSENKRISKVLELLINNSVFALGYSSNQEIDEINILNATKLAMKRAVKNLNAKPATLLIDGNPKLNAATLLIVFNADLLFTIFFIIFLLQKNNLFFFKS